MIRTGVLQGQISLLIFSHPSPFSSPHPSPPSQHHHRQRRSGEKCLLFPLCSREKCLIICEDGWKKKSWAQLEEAQLGTAGEQHSETSPAPLVTPHFSPAVLPLLYFYFIEERMKLLKSFYFFLSSPSQTSLPLYQSWNTFGVYSLGSDHEKLWWKGLGWEIFSLLPMEKLWARPHCSCSRSNQRGIEMEGCWDGWIDRWMDGCMER